MPSKYGVKNIKMRDSILNGNMEGVTKKKKTGEKCLEKLRHLYCTLNFYSYCKLDCVCLFDIMKCCKNDIY